MGILLVLAVFFGACGTGLIAFRKRFAAAATRTQSVLPRLQQHPQTTSPTAVLLVGVGFFALCLLCLVLVLVKLIA